MDSKAGPANDTPKSGTAEAARRALELKRKASGGAAPAAAHGRLADERAAAARSASKSKPKLRK